MKKNIDQILQALKIAIEEISLKAISKDTIHDNNTLLDDLNLDSLDFAQVMMEGETFVNAKINDNMVNWRNIKTVADLAQLLYDCQNN